MVRFITRTLWFMILTVLFLAHYCDLKLLLHLPTTYCRVEHANSLVKGFLEWEAKRDQ